MADLDPNGAEAGTMETVPGVPLHVCHYWRRSRRPFLNLSELYGAELEAVIADLVAERRVGSHRRSFGRRYMQLRARTEAKMRRLFIDQGGTPERLSPHYFVLGDSRWFRGLADDMETIAISIEDLPDAVTSFTYPDSFTAMGFAAEFGLPYEAKPYHNQVFRLADLEAVIDRYGMPSDSGGEYEGYERRPFEMYIEVQVWSDEPVSKWLPPSEP